MKLFVMGPGAPSGDPREWSEFEGYLLVQAQSAEQALELAGDMAFAPAYEVLDWPAVLCRVHE